MKVASVKEIKPKFDLVANTRFKVVSADSGRNQCGWHNLRRNCQMEIVNGFFTSRFKGGCYLMPDL